MAGKRSLEEMERGLRTESFDAEVAARVAVMQAELEALCSEMRSTVTLELTRLPPRVRAMRAKDFFGVYHGDIVEALRSGGASAVSAAVPASASK